jgi:hypothetical protein
MFSGILVLFALPQLSASAEEIWVKVVGTYAKMPSHTVQYTTLIGSKTVYSGTLKFKRKDSYNFTLTDHELNLTSGEDWNQNNRGSTWVSPSSERGYNDTLSDRQPYLMMRLVRGKQIKIEFLPRIRPGTENRTKTWVLDTVDHVQITIDSANFHLIKIVGEEPCHSGKTLTTVFHEPLPAGKYLKQKKRKKG